MLVYAITANYDGECDSLGQHWEVPATSCLALFGDYDVAHEHWQRLMSKKHPECITELAWTTWSIDEPNHCGIDGEFHVATWTSDGKKDGEVMYDKEGLEYNFGYDSDIDVDTIWIGIGKFAVIDEATQGVICYKCEIISSGKTHDFAKANMAEYEAEGEGKFCKLQAYRIKQVKLGTKPDLLN